MSVLIFLLLLNFIFIFIIYPFIVKQRLNWGLKNEKVFNKKIKVSKVRYISTGFSCACLIFLLIYEWRHAFIYSLYVDYKLLGLASVIALFFIIISLVRLVFLFPRKYFLFQNNKMYYHNGIKEVCLDMVENVTTIEIGLRNIYWYLIIKTDYRKKIWIDILLFSAPEAICHMIKNMIKED